MTVKVKVISQAKKVRIEPLSDSLKVYLTKPPLNDKANKQLIEVIAKHYQVKKSKVSIIKGLKQKEKILEILS